MASKYSIVVDPSRPTSSNTDPNPVTVANVVDPATTNRTSVIVLPLAMKSFFGLKALNSPA